MRSLNEFLSRGPIILEYMCALLLRFRTKRIGIITNIKKTLLQVGLKEQDRDVTRFLWIKDTKTTEINNNLETYRLTRIPFDIISSPFLFENTIQHHLGEYNSAIEKHSFQDSINPICNCGNDVESAIHFFLHCPLYSNECCTLLNSLSKIDHKLLDSTDTSLTWKLILYYK